MIALLVAVLVVAVGAAAGTYGLWFGERGRRIAAENMLVNGTPDRPTSTTLRPLEDPEVEAARMVREREIDDLAQFLAAQPTPSGRPFTPEELRAEAARIRAELAG